MISWRFDRLFRSGAACGVAACAVPLIMAVALGATSESDRLVWALGMGIIFMACAVIAGSTLVMGIGVLLFAGVTAADGTSPIGYALVGAGLYVAFMLHSLSVSFRRAPGIDRTIWKGSGATTTAVVIAGWGASFVSYRVATQATWDIALIPLALVGVGLAARVLAERHQRHFPRTRKGKSSSLQSQA